MTWQVAIVGLAECNGDGIIFAWALYWGCGYKSFYPENSSWEWKMYVTNPLPLSKRNIDVDAVNVPVPWTLFIAQLWTMPVYSRSSVSTEESIHSWIPHGYQYPHILNQQLDFWRFSSEVGFGRSLVASWRCSDFFQCIESNLQIAKQLITRTHCIYVGDSSFPGLVYRKGTEGDGNSFGTQNENPALFKGQN